MKLRNKKTGEIIEVGECGVGIESHNYQNFYRSIAGLNDEWEDYEPAEPLIKDEKVRKAVRAWAEINSVREVSYAARLYGSSCMLTSMDDDQFSIEFVGWIPTLKDDEATYSIAELCGEDEE